MAANTLNNRSSGETILATFWNDIHSALNGDFVGRNSSGVPAASKNLGSAAFPWGTLRADGLVINGSSVDLSQVAAPPFRVVSGATRATSNQPAFIDPAGAAGGASFTILAATTSLVFDINGSAKTLSADIVKSGLSAAPSSNNTALVDDALAVDQEATRTFGESDGPQEIKIDTIGSELVTLNGTLQAFKINDGANDEFFMGFLDTTNTKITKCFRGFFYDSSLLPINRIKFANNDTITLMKMHYIFLDQNLTTVDTTTTPPVYDTIAPSTPATGDYWFDQGNKLWKRFDGATFQNVNRTFIGWAVMDDTDCIAARSVHFDVRYSPDNDIILDKKTDEIIEGRSFFGKVNVAGKEILYVTKLPAWNITTDLAPTADLYNAAEQASTTYFVYVKDDGAEILSDISPYFVPEFYGFYHPHNPWRAIFTVENDASSDLENLVNIEAKIKVAIVSDEKSAGTDGGDATSGAWRTRVLNTLSDPDSIGIALNNDKFKLPPGKYTVIAFSTFFSSTNHSKFRIVEDPDGTAGNIALSMVAKLGAGINTHIPLMGRIDIAVATDYEIQYRVEVTNNTVGLGSSTAIDSQVEIYSLIEIMRTSE